MGGRARTSPTPSQLTVVASLANGLGTDLGDRFRATRGPSGRLAEANKGRPNRIVTRKTRREARLVRRTDELLNLHGKEGVDGSSPSEGLPKVPANRHLVVVCLLNTRTHSGHICGTRDASRRLATSCDTLKQASVKHPDRQNACSKTTSVVWQDAKATPSLQRGGQRGHPTARSEPRAFKGGARGFESRRSRFTECLQSANRVASVGAIGATERDRLLPERYDGGVGGAQIACKAGCPRLETAASLARNRSPTRWTVRGLVSRVAEGDERVERVPAESQRCPAVALAAALPELPVGKAGEEAAVGGEERVGHRRQRLRQPAR